MKKFKDYFKHIKVNNKAAYYFLTGIILSILPLFLFLGIVKDYYKSGKFWFDKKVFDYLYSIRNEGLTTVFKLITGLGYTIPMVILTLIVSVIIFRFRNKKESLFFMANILGLSLFNELLKWIFRRNRPEGNRLIEAVGYSFPSGHAMVFMGFSLLIIYLLLLYFKNKKTAWLISILVFIFAVMVGISRVYLGVHYFSDVAAGWLVGIMWAAASAVIHNAFIKEKTGSS